MLKLFKIFSCQPWIVHSQRETDLYINKIFTETTRISQGAILPLLQTNAKLLTGLAILTGQLQILGFFILEYFPFFEKFG